jgi:hypothetical protein
MANAALSRRVEKAVAYPPLSELATLSGASSTRPPLDADSFEDMRGLGV